MPDDDLESLFNKLSPQEQEEAIKAVEQMAGGTSTQPPFFAGFDVPGGSPESFGQTPVGPEISPARHVYTPREEEARRARVAQGTKERVSREHPNMAIFNEAYDPTVSRVSAGMESMFTLDPTNYDDIGLQLLLQPARIGAGLFQTLTAPIGGMGEALSNRTDVYAQTAGGLIGAAEALPGQAFHYGAKYSPLGMAVDPVLGEQQRAAFQKYREDLLFAASALIPSFTHGPSLEGELIYRGTPAKGPRLRTAEEVAQIKSERASQVDTGPYAHPTFTPYEPGIQLHEPSEFNPLIPPPPGEGTPVSGEQTLPRALPYGGVPLQASTSYPAPAKLTPVNEAGIATQPQFRGGVQTTKGQAMPMGGTYMPEVPEDSPYYVPGPDVRAAKGVYEAQVALDRSVELPKEIEATKAKLKQAEAGGDKAGIQKYTRQLSDLERELRGLKAAPGGRRTVLRAKGAQEPTQAAGTQPEPSGAAEAAFQAGAPEVEALRQKLIGHFKEQGENALAEQMAQASVQDLFYNANIEFSPEELRAQMVGTSARPRVGTDLAGGEAVKSTEAMDPLKEKQRARVMREDAKLAELGYSDEAIRGLRTPPKHNPIANQLRSWVLKNEVPYDSPAFTAKVTELTQARESGKAVLTPKTEEPAALAPKVEAAPAEPPVRPAEAVPETQNAPAPTVRLYRVEPNPNVLARSDKGAWLQKHMKPEEWQKFESERGRLFADNTKAIEPYGHNEADPGNGVADTGMTTYYVDVPRDIAEAIKRRHDSGFNEYVVPAEYVAKKRPISSLSEQAPAPQEPKTGLTKTAPGIWQSETGHTVIRQKGKFTVLGPDGAEVGTFKTQKDAFKAVQDMSGGGREGPTLGTGLGGLGEFGTGPVQAGARAVGRGVGHVVKGLRDQLSELGDAGHRLATLTATVHRDAMADYGRFSERYLQAWNQLSPQEQKFWRENARQIVRDPDTFESTPAFDRFLKERGKIMDAVEAEGAQAHKWIQDPTAPGGLRRSEFAGKGTDFLSQQYRPEVLERLRAGDPELEAELFRRNPELKGFNPFRDFAPTEAVGWERTMRRRRDVFSEKARTLKVPDEWLNPDGYDTDLNFIQHATKATAEHRLLKFNDVPGASMGVMDDLFDQIAQQHGQGEAQRAVELVRHYMGWDPNPLYRSRAGRAWKAFQDFEGRITNPVRMAFNVATGLQQGSQAVMTATMADTPTAWRGLVDTVSNWRERRAEALTGGRAPRSRVFADVGGIDEGRVSRRFADVSSATIFYPDAAMRTVASATAPKVLEKWTADIAAGGKDGRTALRQLRKMHLLEEDIQSIQSGKPSPEAANRFAQAFVEETQGSANRGTLPPWASHPAAETAMRLKKFAFANTRLYVNNVLSEAANGNPKPLIRALAWSQGVGEILGNSREALFGPSGRRKDIADIVKDEDWKAAFIRMLDNLDHAAFLGMVGTVTGRLSEQGAQEPRPAQGSNPLWQTVTPPALTEAVDVTNAGLKLVRGEKDLGESGTELVRQVGALRQIHDAYRYRDTNALFEEWRKAKQSGNTVREAQLAKRLGAGKAFLQPQETGPVELTPR